MISPPGLSRGARHPDMKKHVEDAFILTCNISLEYEKSEVNSSFMYSDAAQREKMVAAEREYTDDVVRQVGAGAVCVVPHPPVSSIIHHSSSVPSSIHQPSSIIQLYMVVSPNMTLLNMVTAPITSMVRALIYVSTVNSLMHL